MNQPQFSFRYQPEKSGKKAVQPGKYQEKDAVVVDTINQFGKRGGELGDLAAAGGKRQRTLPQPVRRAANRYPGTTQEGGERAWNARIPGQIPRWDPRSHPRLGQ